jgi:hypothetical protein
MAAERVADMTIQELKALIDSAVERKMRVWSGPGKERPSNELWASMLKNIIKPAPGERTALELLREERDQWYSHS